jgi:hypothetical protein
MRTIKILNQAKKRPVDLRLIQSFDCDVGSAINEQWKAMLNKQFAKAKMRWFSLPNPSDVTLWDKILGQYSIQDYLWDWSRQFKSALATPNCEVWVIQNRATIEAAMIMTVGKELRHSTQSHKGVYIDYLAVAPWNRKSIRNPPQFKGLGTVLIGCAVTTSITQGYAGRCGLVALPQAVPWYEMIGMKNYGIIGTAPLPYLEFDHLAALTFLKQGTV